MTRERQVLTSPEIANLGPRTLVLGNQKLGTALPVRGASALFRFLVGFSEPPESGRGSAFPFLLR